MRRSLYRKATGALCRPRVETQIVFETGLRGFTRARLTTNLPLTRSILIIPLASILHGRQERP